MAGQTVVVSVLADTKNFSKNMKATQSAGDKFKATSAKIGIGAGIALGALVAVGKKAEAYGEAASTADARIAQITKSMGQYGDGYQKVADRVSKSAEKLALTTGIDPNLIKQGQATLSTFSKIESSADKVGGAFDRATKLSADLSASGFGSVQSASLLLGKALNDPVKGVSALTRVGVTLTDQQKEQIASYTKLGQTAKAQNVILGAVEKQVGGVATATANASDKMNVKWQLTYEKIGKQLLPFFEKVRVALGNLADFIGNNTGLVIKLAAGIGILAGVLVTLSAIVKVVTTVQAALNIVMSLNPVGLIVIGIIALIAVIVLLVTHWKQVTQFLSAAWSKVVKTISASLKALGDFFGDVFSDIGKGIKAALSFILGLFLKWTIYGFIITHFSQIKTFVLGVFTAIRTGIKTALDAVLTTVKTIVGNIVTAFLKIVTGIAGAVVKVIDKVTNLKDRIFSILGLIPAKVVSIGVGIITGILTGIKNSWSRLTTYLGGIGGRILKAVGNASLILYSAGKNILIGFLNGLKAEWKNVTDFVGGIGKWIADNKGPKSYDLALLVPAGGYIMQGLQNGIEASIPGLKTTLDKVTSTISATDFSSGVRLDTAAFTEAGTLRGGNNYQISLSTLNPSLEAGRAIVSSINDYNRLNGNR